MELDREKQRDVKHGDRNEDTHGQIRTVLVSSAISI